MYEMPTWRFPSVPKGYGSNGYLGSPPLAHAAIIAPRVRHARGRIDG